MAIFQAVLFNSTLQDLCVYDHVQRQGQDLQRLLENILKMKLQSLHINLNFTDKQVISSFHQNITIRHLRSGEHAEEITAGPVFSSLERNRLLHDDDVRLAVETINVKEKPTAAQCKQASWR